MLLLLNATSGRRGTEITTGSSCKWSRAYLTILVQQVTAASNWADGRVAGEEALNRKARTTDAPGAGSALFISWSTISGEIGPGRGRAHIGFSLAFRTNDRRAYCTVCRLSDVPGTSPVTFSSDRISPS